jgi:hypothetical protein
MVLAILYMKIFIDPHYQMVFECAFYELVKEIGCEKDMNIGAREAMSERLRLS